MQMPWNRKLIVLATLMLGITAAGSCSSDVEQGKSDAEESKQTSSVPQPKAGVTPGAQTLNELLLRMDKAQADHDSALMMTCFPCGSDEEKRSSDVLARDMLSVDRIQAFFEEGKKKFGSDFQRALGPTAIGVAVKGQRFKFAEAADLEPIIKENVASLAVPMAFRGQSMMSFEEKDGRWYVNPAKEWAVAVQEARDRQRFLDEIGALAEKTGDLKEFGEEVLVVYESINPEWADVLREQRRFWTPGVDE